MLAQKRATTSRPSYSKGIGGIEMKTSSVSRATSASRSADSYARTNFATIASSAGEPGAGGGSRPAAGGSRRCRLARARLRALLTDSTVESSMLGHLAGVESEDVAQDEHGELARRQDLQRGHEGQRDGFGLLVAGLRAGRRVDRTLEEGVGKRLEPYDLAEPGRLGRFNPGDVPLLGGAPAGRATRVEAPVGGDPVEPGAERGASLEPAEALPGGQQRVLQGVLGILEGSEHPVAVHLELSAVRLGQLPERVAVAGPRPRDQVGCHHRPSRHLLPEPRRPLILHADTARGANWALRGRRVSSPLLDRVAGGLGGAGATGWGDPAEGAASEQVDVGGQA